MVPPGVLRRACMASALCAVLFTVAPGSLRATDRADVDRETAVDDSFQWAEGIIEALGALAPPLPPIPPPAVWAPRRAKPRRARIRVRRGPPPFVVRHFMLHRSTVFGIFDLTVDETSPESFDLVVGSDEPAEEVQIQDRYTHAIVLERPLDDERVFRVHVPGAFSRRLAVCVSLSQAGEIDKAYFPLFERGSR